MKNRTTKHVTFVPPLIAIGFALLAAASAGAQTNPRYVAELPSVRRVLADVQGSDRHDTLARQRGAFEMLLRGMRLVAGPREFSTGFTPDEQRVMRAYGDASKAVRDEAYGELSNDPPRGLNPFAQSPLQEWNARAYRYQRDPEIRDALLRRYLSSDAYAAISTAYRDDDATLRGESPVANRFEFDESTLQVVRAVLGLAFGLVVLAFVREWLAFGVQRGNPLALRAGFRTYPLGWATGRVTDYKTWTDVEVTEHKEVTQTQYGVVLSERTIGFTRREYVHETFTLLSASESSHPVHVVNAKLRIPDGNVATAVWAANKSGGGSYVLFFDRTTAQTRPIAPTVAYLLKVGRLMYLPVLVLAVIIGAGAASSAGGASQTLGVLMGLFVGFVVGAALFKFIASRRARRFAKAAPRVLTAIDLEESKAAT